MKRLLIGLILVMMAIALVLGCTAKESGEDATKEPAATQEAESMDTTSMDSAMMTDTTHDTM
ncbi:MAG TPA: hypothetical protein VHP63_01495 [candidate division Zixibacteria bacterium]|nr:hypothetical protein [candidate division Zixibacteria bacterium]